MSRALNALAARHEAFRTAIVVENGAPLQKVCDGVEVPFVAMNLQDVPRGEREAKARRATMAETRQEFRLDQPPLLRALMPALLLWTLSLHLLHPLLLLLH